VHKTDDGFVVLGGSGSIEMPGNPDNSVFWFFKADNAGDIIWEHAYGGSGVDAAVQLLPTSDKGYLLFGDTGSNDGDVSGNHGYADVWVVKTDSMGQMEWQRCYGGSSLDWADNIIATADGGYVFTASATSTDGDVGGVNPGFNVWVLKITGLGEIVWSQVFGGTAFMDMAGHIIETSDGGFFLSATVSSTEVCPGAVPGLYTKLWLIKLDGNGETEWQQCYGGSHSEAGASIVQTPDGGYAFAAKTSSNNGDVSGCMGIPGDPHSSSLWFVKTDESGTIEWQRCLGGFGNDAGRIFELTEEGNYLIGGSTTSSTGDVNCSNIAPNIKSLWIFELSPTGEILWQRCLGSSRNDHFASMHRYSPSNIIITATVSWADDDVDCTMHGRSDIWVVEIEDTGVGFAEASSQSGIELFPNPATTEAWLQLPENTPLAQVQIELYSPTGRLLYKAQPTSQFHKIEVKNLPKGLYLVRVWDGVAWKTNMLILE